MKEYPKISIILLNWNGWKDTIECLESLYQITYLNYEIIVLDNNSEDNSLEEIDKWAEGKNKIILDFMYLKNKPVYSKEIKELSIKDGGAKVNNNMPFEKRLTLIKNDKNYGFAEGNNIGIKYALKTSLADYILLLNNDTTVDANFLIELVKVAESKDKFAACGSKMLFYNEENSINYAGGIFTILGRGYDVGFGENSKKKIFNTEKITGIPCGGAMLVKSSILNKLGGFDPNYFAYHEDTDLAWKLWIMGYKLYYVPTSIVYHKYRGSWEKVSEKRLFFGVRNRLYNIIKHFEIKNVILGLLFSIFYIFCEIVFYAAIKPNLSIAIFKGSISFIKTTPIMLKKRKDIQKLRIISDEELMKMGIFFGIKDSFNYLVLKKINDHIKYITKKIISNF